MDIMKFFELFSLITGVVYLYLEVRQKNAMWVLGIFTAMAAVVVFMQQKLYASMGLNFYYTCVSFWGLYSWMKDSRKLKNSASSPEASSPKETIHLRRISVKTMIVSLFVLVVGTFAFSAILVRLGDPASLLDSGVTVLSAIATVWLARSYPCQWILWIIADLLSAVMCFSAEIYWMCALYGFYSISAIYGYFHWRSKGVYIE